MDPRLATGRLVLISPHLDDAVLSLGALIGAAPRSGARVELLTVFAGNPAATQAAGPWDRKSGFATAGEAARQRRLEDQQACALLGARAHCLSFGDEQYERGGDEASVLAAVAAIARGADTLLVPGFPLHNADHAWLSRILLAVTWPGSRIALYAEQPYLYTARRSHSQPGTAPALAALLARPPHWESVPYEAADRRLKHRAIRCYGSQLRQLGLSSFGLWRLLQHESRRGGETIAWLD